jgi:hypothetical protein
MAISNKEIIAGECLLLGFEWDGNNLYTFAEWQERGYKIVKGQHAIINTKLWKPVTKTDKKTGATETHYIMVNASLFSADQVEPMSDKFKEFLQSKGRKLQFA